MIFDYTFVVRCQEEQTRLGMIKVYSDRFCWSNAQAGMLIAQLEMGDFQAVKQVIFKYWPKFVVILLLYWLFFCYLFSLNVRIRGIDNACVICVTYIYLFQRMYPGREKKNRSNETSREDNVYSSTQ